MAGEIEREREGEREINKETGGGETEAERNRCYILCFFIFLFARSNPFLLEDNYLEVTCLVQLEVSF